MAQQTSTEQDAKTTLEFDRAGEFAKLLNKGFRPSSDDRRAQIEQAVQTFAVQTRARQELEDKADFKDEDRIFKNGELIDKDVFALVDQLKAIIDSALTEQINTIIHNPEFQKLESAWRGLHYLVMNTPTAKDLKIRVMNVTKPEVYSMLRQYRDAAWDQSPLFKKVYEAEFGQLGGQPFGAFMCDYYFDESSPDIEIMKGLTKIGAACHAPLIAGAAPSMLGMESWQDLASPRDLANRFSATQYREWNAFRASEDSRYLALTLPRFLGRKLYGAKSEPVEAFAFEEETEGGKHDNHLWVNAGYGLAVRINEAFKTFGWCTQIRGVESGGTVEDLPTAAFPTDDGGIDIKCPTEIAISDRREAELSRVGFMALIHRKNTNQATFIGGQTVHEPEKYEDPGATANANLSARLPYIFASCRFAHYLKCMVRDWVGSYREREQLERDLTSWVMQYVDGQPDSSDEVTKARKPLKDAKIQIEPDEENPGYYRGIFRFVPHYQFEGADVALSLVSRLPASK